MTKTMANLIVESLKTKYFQNTLNPLIIVEGPSSIEPSMMGAGPALSCWSPLEERYYNLSLDELNLYREISKEYFNEVKELYNKGLESQIEKDFDIRPGNKADLSEQKTKNLST